jgi:hypothetical protein
VAETPWHGRVHVRTGRTRGHGPSWAAGMWALPFKFFSKSAQTLKFKTKVFPMSKIHQILQVDSMKYQEKLYFLDKLENLVELKVINSGTNSDLNFL